MREKTIKLYQFDELSDKAKDRAREWMRNGALDYEWWEFIYEDAERVGLKIQEFDLDRHRHVKGYLTVSLAESIKAIFAEHGKDCETYKLATEFQNSLNMMDKDGDDYEDDIDSMTKEYTESLCEEYSIMLQHEYEYRLSDEAIDEDIRANEYEFTEDGERA